MYLILSILGPLELTRRQKVLVWSDEIDVPEETIYDLPNGPASPTLSISSVPLPRRTRSQSTGPEFPPPMRRTSTDASGAPRPVPFAAKFQRVHPGTTGVTVLEHLERLDAVEASLQRLEVDDREEMDEEMDVGEVVQKSKATQVAQSQPEASSSSNVVPTSPFTPPGSPLRTVKEVPSARSSIDEEDLVALSKSTSHVEGVSIFGPQSATFASAGMDWIQRGESPAKRTVIAEVRLS